MTEPPRIGWAGPGKAADPFEAAGIWRSVDINPGCEAARCQVTRGANRAIFKSSCDGRAVAAL